MSAAAMPAPRTCEAVGEAPSRPAGNGAGHGRMMCGVAEQGGTVARVSEAFVAPDEGGAELGRRRAEAQRRRDTAHP